MESLETYLRLAIDFAGRTAYPASDYDCKPLRLLESTAKHVHNMKRKKEVETENNPEIISFIQQIETLMNENSGVTPFQMAKEITIAAEIASYGNRQDSNLDAYGYDMVFGATLGSIDSVMKEYIDKAAATLQASTIYFMERINGSQVTYEKATEEEVKILESLELFNISNDPTHRTSKQKMDLDTAYDIYLAFAFKAAIGFPEGASVDKIIDFNTGETGNHTKVEYSLYFKEFSIIQFMPLRRTGYIFNNFAQASDLWAFHFTVDLSLVGVSLETLPESVRDKINNIDPGTMFSISQLFLDLNEPCLLSFPTIKGLQPEVMEALNSKFVTFYFRYLREHTGDPIIGYSMTLPQDGSSTKPYLFTPKDFRFYVSPYYENGQPAPQKKKLYALNYIVICEDKPFPELRNITWNWVDEQAYQYTNGAMSFSQKQMYKFAKEQYKILLAKLLFTTTAKITIDDPIYIYWEFGLNKDYDTKVEFNGNTFEYERQCADSDWFIPLWGNVDLSYNVKGVVRNYQTVDNKSILECRIDIKSYLHINVIGGVSEGTIYDTTTWYTLEINVDQYGKLTLSPSIVEDSNKTTFTVSGWSEFWGIGFEDSVNSLNRYIKNAIADNKKYWDDCFKDKYNGNMMWFLPGDRSLLFKEPGFSNKCDLTFKANYASPTNETDQL